MRGSGVCKRDVIGLYDGSGVGVDALEASWGGENELQRRSLELIVVLGLRVQLHEMS